MTTTCVCIMTSWLLIFLSLGWMTWGWDMLLQLHSWEPSFWSILRLVLLRQEMETKTEAIPVAGSMDVQLDVSSRQFLSSITSSSFPSLVWPSSSLSSCLSAASWPVYVMMEDTLQLILEKPFSWELQTTQRTYNKLTWGNFLLYWVLDRMRLSCCCSRITDWKNYALITCLVFSFIPCLSPLEWFSWLLVLSTSWSTWVSIGFEGQQLKSMLSSFISMGLKWLLLEEMINKTWDIVIEAKFAKSCENRPKSVEEDVRIKSRIM